jgi:segregation and condensation protein B
VITPGADEPGSGEDMPGREKPAVSGPPAGGSAPAGEDLTPGGAPGGPDDGSPAGEAPLEDVPAGGVPLEDVPAGGVPLQDVPAGGVPLQDVPAGGVPPEGALAAVSLSASLEAILLVVDEPVAEVVLAQVLERPRHEVAAALRQLAASYDEQSRGFDLREVAGGWRYYTREDCAPVVERFVRDGQEVRLTQAALETLAVVAYRQPVSRVRVSAVRGVNCDGVMRTLTLRGLVEEAGTDRETGAILYRTTGYFLERLGLASLEDLPELAPFLPDELEDHEETGHERAGT